MVASQAWAAGVPDPGADRERVRRDVGDVPAAAERDDELVLANPAGAPVSGLAAAEAQQVAAAAGPQHRRQAGDVPDAPLVVEDVEQPCCR